MLTSGILSFMNQSGYTNGCPLSSVRQKQDEIIYHILKKAVRCMNISTREVCFENISYLIIFLDGSLHVRKNESYE